MKISILGYTLTAQKTQPTPEQVEAYAMKELERDCRINITAQGNQLDFLHNILDVYKEQEKDEKITQTEASIEAAENTRTQWTVQLETINLWKRGR